MASLCIVQGGSNMTGTNCDLFTHESSRSYLNHLVISDRRIQAINTSEKFVIFYLTSEQCCCFRNLLHLLVLPHVLLTSGTKFTLNPTRATQKCSTAL